MKKNIIIIIIMLFLFCPVIAKAGELKIYAIDIGATSGDSVLLESQGKYLLMDTGPSNNNSQVIDYLKSKNINKLSIYVSHMHADHYGLLDPDKNNNIYKDNYFTIEKVYMPNINYLTQYNNGCDESASGVGGSVGCELNAYNRIVNKVGSSKITTLTKGSSFTFGDATINVLWQSNPSDCYANTAYNDSFVNNMSLVTMVTVDNIKYLTAGDIEEYTENKLISNNIDVSANIFKLSHHGYYWNKNQYGVATSNSNSFMSKVNPQYSFLQYGTGNSEANCGQASKFLCAPDPNKDQLEHVRDTLAVKYHIINSRYNGTTVFTINNNKISVSMEKNKRNVKVNYIIKEALGDSYPSLGTITTKNYTFNNASNWFIRDYTKSFSAFGSYIGLSPESSVYAGTLAGAAGTSDVNAYVVFNRSNNKVQIKYKLNSGDSLSEQHGDNISVDSSNYITKDNNTVLQTIRYGETMSEDGLLNYNNSGYINIIKTGYHGKEGAEFKDSSGNTYNQDTPYKASDFCNASSGNCTKVLYVNWEVNNYTIKYNANGGSGTVTQTSATYGSNVTLATNSFTKTGYHSNGWNKKNDGTGTHYSDGATVKNLTSTNNGTVTLYAQWEANSYTIKYSSNGGSGSMSNTSATYGTNVTLTSNNFTKAGYHFTGWNTKANGSGTSYNNGASVSNLTSTNNGSVTLYAQWSPNAYTIKYSSNGGSGSMSNTSATYDKNITLISNNFTKTGYHFTGWNTKSDGSGTSYSNGASVSNLTSTNNGSVTLYAQWSPNTYTIKYSSNGGSGSMSNTSATYNTNVTLRSNTFTRNNYSFIGWNTKADGSGTNYSDGASVKNLTSSNNYTVILYAQWGYNGGESSSYLINYNVDDSNMTIDNISLKTTLNSYKNHFVLGDGYTMSISLGDKQYIYTGSKVSILLNGSTEATFTNIVRGDTSGDGQVNSADMLQLRQHMLNAKTLTGVYFKAGDIDNNNAINSADLLRMRQHLLGVKPIS